MTRVIRHAPRSILRLPMRASLLCALGALIGLVAAPSPTMAGFKNNTPIWSQVDVLICKGSYRLVCVEEVCFKKTSKAEWRIDFKKKKIFKGGFAGPAAPYVFAEEIISNDFAFYGEERGSSHVIFFSGRLMSFDMDEAANAGGDAVSARSLHLQWRKPNGFDWEDENSSVETRFGCAPQELAKEQ